MSGLTAYPSFQLGPRDAVSFGMPYLTGNGFTAVDFLSVPAVNIEDMTVRMRISTDCIDRDRMVIDQSGIDDEYYIDNPVVLYGHGEQGIVLPVAISEDPNGKCTVWKDGNGTWAIAHHNPSDKVSSQMFDAVVNKLLRAASVGVTPKPGGVSSRLFGGEKIPVVDACWLNEWSYCAVPVNPQSISKSMGGVRAPVALLEAVALQSEIASSLLMLDRLDGQPIVPQIKRALQSMVPSKLAMVNGAKMKKSLSLAQVRSLSRLDLFKAFKAKNEYDEETQESIDKTAEEKLPEEGQSKDQPPVDGKPVDPAAAKLPDPNKPAGQPVDGQAADPNKPQVPGAAGQVQDPNQKPQVPGQQPDPNAAGQVPGQQPVDGQKPVDGNTAKDPNAQDPNTPAPGPGANSADAPGSVVVRAGHDAIQAAMDVFLAELVKVELPEYKDAVMREVDVIATSLKTLAELHDSNYPTAPSIAGQEVDQSAEFLKSLWNVDARKVVGIKHMIRTLQKCADRVGNSQIAKSLRDNSGYLERMVQTAEKTEVVSLEEYLRIQNDNKRLKSLLHRANAAFESLTNIPEPVYRR